MGEFNKTDLENSGLTTDILKVFFVISGEPQSFFISREPQSFFISGEPQSFFIIGEPQSLFISGEPQIFFISCEPQIFWAFLANIFRIPLADLQKA